MFPANRPFSSTFDRPSCTHWVAFFLKFTVAIRFSPLSAKYFSIYSSYMRLSLLLLFSTLDSTMSSALTSLCWGAKRTAKDKPTFPVLAIFIFDM